MSTSSPRPPLRSHLALILVLQCAIVLACVAVTTIVAMTVQERSIRAAMSERVLDVSESLADLDQVQDSVQLPTARAMSELQPLADIVEEAAGVDYVVVTDAAGIRLTHPTESARGEVVSTDPSDVLAGETFVGTETGTLGPTLRAKVPVYDGDEIVGTASVGILESDIAAEFAAAQSALLPWVLGSVVVGVLLSALATSLLRRRVRHLEDRARDLETQRRIADALRDQTHEFRTRLHVVRGLVAEGDTGEALTYIDRIAPVTTDPRVSVALADPALRGLLESHANEYAAEDGRFEVDPESSVEPDVLVDADLIVIANLCRNAAEAAGPGGRVAVRIVADRSAVHIDVRDDGPGVPDDLVHRIFDRGVSTKGSGELRGVGLDIVRREIAARRGSIMVARSEWGGARFTADLPTAGRRVAQ